MGRLAAAVAAACAAASGCSPCAEMAACSTPARVSYTVQIIEHATGRPVGGVRLRLLRTGGARLVRDTVDAVSGDDGFAALRVDAVEAGVVLADVVITPPAPRLPYRAIGLRFETTTVRGEGGVLGRWAVDPYIEFVGEVGDYGAGTRVQGARVTFVRSGGLGTTPDTLVSVTDAGGRFFLNPRVQVGAGAVAGELAVIGDLTVEGGTIPHRVVFLATAIPALYVDRAPQVGAIYDVGPLLSRSSGDARARAGAALAGAGGPGGR